MDFYNGEEICELLGIFTYNKLSDIIDKSSIGFYRDDDLGVFDKLSGPQIEQRRTKIIKIFEDCGLSITVTANITSVDFLNLALNLKTESYQPFRKPNSDPIYRNIDSNYSPQILKEFPKWISKRLSQKSSLKEIFDKSKAIYETSLNNSGFHENLNYHQDNGNKSQHKKIKNANTK